MNRLLRLFGQPVLIGWALYAGGLIGDGSNSDEIQPPRRITIRSCGYEYFKTAG